MKIELKNIKHAAFASEETQCYSASLYVDGLKIGVVSNDGHGGPDRFYGDMRAYVEANRWCQDNLPPIADVISADLETHCGNLLDKHLAARDLKRALTAKVLWIEPGEDGIQGMRWKGVRKVSDIHIACVKQEVPNATILNAIPFDDALKVYMSNGVSQ